ncbi:MAG: M43 family zinc metalloprotease [Bacteroidota bacterium]
MRVAILIICCLVLAESSAQHIPSPNILWREVGSEKAFCQSDSRHEHQLNNNPTYRQKHQQLSQQAYRIIRQKQAKGGLRSGPYLLPIVVHIIHDNGPENIPDNQVQTAIQHLNDAFANRGYYDPQSGAPTDIEFCLALRDPNDKLSNGINRIQSSLTDFDMIRQDELLKNLVRWDPTCYINLWVVQEIRNSSTGDGVAGYATLPTSHGLPTDGIVMEASFFGSSEAKSSVTVHEMGHYLGLYHTFQGGCTNDDCLQDGDQVCDTPPDQTTARVPCGQPNNTCQTDTQSGLASDLPDMINNYMDYSRLECYNAFTAGQVERMHFFLDGARQSLTQCPSCITPCTNPIIPQVSVDSLSISAGSQLTFDNQTQGADQFAWYINDSLVSNAMDLSHFFEEAGSFKVRMLASNQAGNCASDTLFCIDVNCSIEATFTSQAADCLSIGDQVLFLNQSAAGLRYEWYVNRIQVSTDRDLTYTFSTAGIFRIQLLVSNGFCQSSSTVYTLRVQCQEICDNGLDDDGDGLVDCFDEDCCTQCDAHYFTACVDSCSVPSPASPFAVSLQKVSVPRDFNDMNNIVAGDIDQDGIVEVVGGAGSSAINASLRDSVIAIYEPTEGRVQQFLRYQNYFFTPFQSPLLADVTGDGFAEIFTTVSPHSAGFGWQSTPICFTWDGTSYVPMWMSPSGMGYGRDIYQALALNSINLAAADFDENGTAEIYALNQIWDAMTGRLLASGGSMSSAGVINPVFTKSFSHAIDVLPDDFCPDCSGLELVAGNQVYAVGQTPDWHMEVVAELPDFYDGYSSVVDFDLDGDLDAIVLAHTFKDSVSVEVAVWDIQTPNLLAPILRLPRSITYYPQITPAAIGSLDGDEYPDMALMVKQMISTRVSGMRLYSFSNRADHWEPLFERQLIDRSGVGGCILFDFQSDGKSEILHRGERTFSIISGENGDVLYESPEVCQSNTNFEHPIVVDIDNDQEAEILTGCYGEIHIFESDGAPWAKTRNLWNQFNYFNVNINDDLSVPIHQQAHHLPGDPALNSFLSQYTIPSSLVPDLDLSLLEIDSCWSPTAHRILLSLCNTGEVAIDSLYLTAYERDPQVDDASVVDQFAQFNRLEPMDCLEVEFFIDPSGLTGLWFTANDDGNIPRPYVLDGRFEGIVKECDFANNAVPLTALPTLPSSNTLDLGPDQVICDNGVFTFEAPDQFASYRWQDGSSARRYTADQAGVYSLRVQDFCGNVQSDTVRIMADSTTVINLGDDFSVCPGTSISLQATGYSRYQWTPPNSLDCDTCGRVTAQVQQATTYVVVGTNDNGCVGVDSIRIGLQDSVLQREFLQICENDSALIFGQHVRQAGVYEQVLQTTDGCDSTLQIVLDVQRGSIGQDSINICPGDSVLIFGSWRSTAGSHVQNFSLPNGCDSTHTTVLGLHANYQNNSSASLCQGDTLLFQGLHITSGGTYQQVYTSVNGCDSIEQIQVSLQDTVFRTETIQICQGDSALVFGQYIQQAGTYQQLLQTTDGCDSTTQMTVDVQAAPITQELLLICPSDSAFLSGQWRSMPGSYAETFPLPNGCDSTHTVVLDFYPAYVNDSSTELCQGDTLFLWGQAITSEGWYQEHFTSVHACDSVERVEVEMISKWEQLDSIWMCHGEFYVFGFDTIRQRGRYTRELVALGEECDTIDILLVNLYQELNIDAITSPSCAGENSGSMELLSDGQDVQYSLDGNVFVRSSFFDNLPPRPQTVFAKDANGCQTQIIFFIEEALPLSVTLPRDTAVQKGQPLQLEASTEHATGGLRYDWQPTEGLSCHDCPNPFLQVTQDVRYVLWVSDENGCSASDSIHIEVIDEPQAFIPNVFSPNGDNLNDRLTVFGGSDVVKVVQFQVFNRWGALVFEQNHFGANDPGLGWDGTFRGELLDSGVYVYKAEVEFASGQLVVLAGNVTLVR